jgi:hypothetical protein
MEGTSTKAMKNEVWWVYMDLEYEGNELTPKKMAYKYAWN